MQLYLRVIQNRNAKYRQGTCQNQGPKQSKGRTQSKQGKSENPGMGIKTIKEIKDRMLV